MAADALAQATAGGLVARTIVLAGLALGPAEQGVVESELLRLVNRLRGAATRSAKGRKRKE
jgi:hypothetical protein